MLTFGTRAFLCQPQQCGHRRRYSRGANTGDHEDSAAAEGENHRCPDFCSWWIVELPFCNFEWDLD